MLREIRARFCHVDTCPYQGARIFLENAGGSLTLKSVVETVAELSAIPDNQGRDNPASREMSCLIARGRSDMLEFLGADDGQIFVGESGTECLFRVIRAAVVGAQNGGCVVGGTLEHPATRSAAKYWAAQTGREYIAVEHDAQTCALGADDYKNKLRADTRVATIIQASPVAGVSADINAIAAAIRETAPECFIIVDGIQHAPHGAVDIKSAGIDAYAVSAYKVFSRHNYGFAWLSPRLANLPHEKLDGTADDFWELGTRDVAAYAAFSEVVHYLDWLGAHFTDSQNRRARVEAAGAAIGAHEKQLVQLMLRGGGKQKGLADMPKVTVIAGANNPRRESLVSFFAHNIPSAKIVRELNNRGIRVHIRKNDYFSANILQPLQLKDCVRVSLCHYNSPEEVLRFLGAVEGIVGGAG